MLHPEEIMDKLEKVAEIIKRYQNIKAPLIPILHEVQECFSYIPKEAQEAISKALHIPLADVYGVITFYSRFTLNPTGKYKVCHCMGTACYVKGSQAVLQATKDKLGIGTGETTADGMFSVDEAYCIGACGLAPVITVNKDVYARITPGEIDGIIESYKTKEGKP